MKRIVIATLALAALFTGAASANIVPSQNGRMQTVEPGTTLSVPSGATLSVAGTTTFSAATVSGSLQTADGVGAVAGTGATAVDVGTGAVHKTIITLSALSLTMTDAGAAGSQGGTKIYDFPEGVIVRGGCTANLTTLAGAGGIVDGAAVVWALGLAAPATDNATLVGTNEADFIASYAGTLTAGAGVFTKYGEPSVTSLDGHTTAKDLYLNAAVPDADSSASDTLAATGTITCVWWQTGDF